MKRSETLRWSQLKVGLLVFVGFLILLWVAFNSDLGGMFSDDPGLRARFPSAEGLLPGASVVFLGLETGSVQSIAFDSSAERDPIVVRLTVDETIRRELRADASARISSLGILGDKYVELIKGDAPAPLPDGAVLVGRRETGLTDLIEPGQRTLERVDTVLANLEEITTEVRRGEGTLGSLVAEDDLHVRLVETLTETRNALADFRVTQRNVGARLASAAGSIDTLAASFHRRGGTLQRLADDPSLYESLNDAAANLSAASVRLERVLARMEEGDGLMARLLKDAELADQVAGIAVDLRALLRDVRENPGRYVQLSVF